MCSSVNQPIAAAFAIEENELDALPAPEERLLGVPSVNRDRGRGLVVDVPSLVFDVAGTMGDSPSEFRSTIDSTPLRNPPKTPV